MFMRQTAIALSLMIGSSVFMPTVYATTAPAQVIAPAPVTPAVTTTTPSAVNTTAVPPTTTPPPLRQNQAAAPLPATVVNLQQKHKQELAEQAKRLALVEQANQEALAQNQALQISNDSLAVQIQVLQSERSAQMFLYGAVTFGVGIFFGIILYSVLYTRRRRSW